MKQLEIKKLNGKIRVITGLHIGGGSDTVEIGGIDNPIVKDPLTGEPYIPGSSLKGKMRSIMEWVLGKVTINNGEPCNCGECEICTVFGTSAASNNKKERDKAFKRGPTRLTVRDAFLSDTFKNKFEEGESIIEEKSENNINRITAKATPRQLERIVPGTEFNFSLSYRVLDMGDNGTQDRDYFETVVKKALAYLEANYLGGGGSRGNGQIKFIELKDENNKEIILPKVI